MKTQTFTYKTGNAGKLWNAKFTSDELTSRSHHTCLCFEHVPIVALSEYIFVSVMLPVNHTFFPPQITYWEIEFTFIYKHLISCIMHLNSHISEKNHKQASNQEILGLSFKNCWMELKTQATGSASTKAEQEEKSVPNCICTFYGQKPALLD